MSAMFRAHDGTRFVCYTTRTGRDRHYLGCAHDTPRQAIAHTVPVFVAATRSGSDEIGPRQGPSEAQTASTRTRRLLPPVGSGSLT